MYEQHQFKKASWFGRILRRVSNYLFSTLVPQGVQRHHTSFFTEKITDYLAKGEPIKSGNRNLYVMVNSIELGDNPLSEEIKIYFHLRETPPPKTEAVWGPRSEEEILVFSSDQKGSARPTLVYTFTSELPLEENLDDFRDYIVNHGDKAKEPPTPQSAKLVS